MTNISNHFQTPAKLFPVQTGFAPGIAQNVLAFYLQLR